MKDIFIDNNIAKDFAFPLNIAYKNLINWLRQYNLEHPEDNAYLVVSQKLLAEYYRSSAGSHSNTSIPSIIDLLTRENRLKRISNKQIKDFKKVYFKKKIRLRSNSSDHDHIPAVLLSERKYALSLDEKFIYDLLNFPGFNVRVEKSPEDLYYK